jgi:hypothetical protein
LVLDGPPATADVQAHLASIDTQLSTISTNAPIVQSIGTPITASSNVLVPTGLSITLATGGFYKITFIGLVQTNVTSCGVRFQATSTETGTPIGYNQGFTGLGNGLQLAYSTMRFNIPFITVGINPINVDVSVKFEFFIRSLNGGTINVDFGAEVNGATVTLAPGATLITQLII